MVVAQPVAAGAMVRKDSGKSQGWAQSVEALVNMAWPAVGNTLVVEGKAPEQKTLLSGQETAGLGSRTSVRLTSLGPGVVGSKSGEPSSCAVF